MSSSKHKVLLVIVCACLVALPALAQPYEKFTDVPADTAAAPPAPQGTPAAPAGGLVFYNNRGTFMADFPGLTSEDFSGTSVAAGGIETCTPPMNSSSNDVCFSPGAIVDGVSIDVQITTGGGLGVVIAPPALSVTSVAVGPNSFADDMVIDLTAPAWAFGLDLLCPLATPTLDITIYGQSGVIGNTTSICGGPPGTFWGVGAGEPITSIEFVSATGDGELASNVLFGGAPVPTAKMPVLAVMFLVLLAGSAFLIWRR